MSSKDKPDLMTTFHHSFIEPKFKYFKTKAVKKNDWDDGHTRFFIKTIKKQQVIKLDDGHT
jgi:hypothetical protein